MSDAVAYHDGLAAGWSARYASGGFRRRAAFFRARVLPRLQVGGDWLDVGCGSGVFSRMLAQGGARVLGIDGSPAMIEAARLGGAGARFEVARVEDVGAFDGAFEGALCLSVLEYLAAPERALAGIANRVKRGGRVCVSLPNSASTLRRLQKTLRPLAERAGAKSLAYLDSSHAMWTRDEALALLAGAGFEVEAILGFDPLAPRLIWPLLSPSLWFVIGRRRG